MSPDPRKIQVLTDMPLPKLEKELQSFLGILNYLIKFTPVTAEVCKPLYKLTSIKTDWTLNRMYQDLYEKAKIIVKNACIMFYDGARSLCMET